MTARANRLCTRRLHSLAAAAALAFLVPLCDGHAAQPPDPAPPDQPLIVDLIDGTVQIVDVGTVQQLAAALANPTDEGAAAALVDILNTSPLPTAVLIVAAYELNPERVSAIARAVAMSNRTDKLEALEMLSYEPGVDGEQLVAGVQPVDPDLAAALADFLVVTMPQNPRSTEEHRSFARATAENPNQISPQKPGELNQ
jgi:hypothetical protein